MKYTEQEAKQIIKKHGLSEKTLDVWKTRGNIPDKYFDENFEMRIPLTRGKQQKYSRLLKILELKGLNKNAIAEMSELSHQTIIDIKRNDFTLSEQDFLKIKRVIAQLKIDIVKAFSHNIHSQNERALKKLLWRSELKQRSIFENFSQLEYENIMRFRRSEITDPNDFEKIKSAYTIFAMQLNIN